MGRERVLLVLLLVYQASSVYSPFLFLKSSCCSSCLQVHTRPRQPLYSPRVAGGIKDHKVICKWSFIANHLGGSHVSSSLCSRGRAKHGSGQVGSPKLPIPRAGVPSSRDFATLLLVCALLARLPAFSLTQAPVSKAVAEVSKYFSLSGDGSWQPVCKK